MIVGTLAGPVTNDATTEALGPPVVGEPWGHAVPRTGARGITRLKAKADAHAANILSRVIEAIRAAEGKTSINANRRGAEQARGILTPNGGQWWATSVRNLLNRTPQKEE
jgi:hypothetical protein